MSGRLEAALPEAQRGLELEPEGLPQFNVLASCYAWGGRFDDAVRAARRLLALSDDPRRIGAVSVVLPQASKRAEVEAIARRIEALPPGSWERESGLFDAYLGLGDTTRALDAAESAAAGDGDLLLSFLPSVHALFHVFRNNERFAAVMRRYNLDPDVRTSLGGAGSRLTAALADRYRIERARRGRDGHRLSGPRPPPRSRCGHQGPPRGRGADAGRRAVSPRNPARRQAHPPAHPPAGSPGEYRAGSAPLRDGVRPRQGGEACPRLRGAEGGGPASAS